MSDIYRGRAKQVRTMMGYIYHHDE